MKVYKFRSVDRFDFLYDIIENKRVYCARYQDLNDPFEGQFVKIYKSQFGSQQQMGTSQMGQTSSRKSLKDKYKLADLRICSFSKSYKDVRMWSYYANAHTGVCIEFDIDEDLIDKDFYCVKYEPELKIVSSEEITREIAINILKRKTDHWKFEEEVRLITEKEKYPLIPQRIIVGHRATENCIGIIKKISNNIPIYDTYLKEDLTVEQKL